jgi:hypothetical protein
MPLRHSTVPEVASTIVYQSCSPVVKATCDQAGTSTPGAMAK